MSTVPGPRDRFPFVVGCGRSGTTLLATMLDSHPDLAMPGESGFLLDACRRVWRPRGEPSAEEFVARLRSFSRFRAWGLDEEALIGWLVAHRPADLADAMRLTYLAYADRNGKTRFGDKTPDHVLVLDRLAPLFPEAVFIHLIRDGRDVALSLLQMPWGPTTVEDAAAFWRLRVEAGRRMGDRLGPGRYLEVRYDDLVADPAATLRRVTGLVNLPFDPGMLDRSGAVERHLRMSPDPESDRAILSRPKTGRRAWAQQMAVEDVALFGAIAGETLARCGFDAGPDLASLPRSEQRHLQARAGRARLRAAVSATKWHLGQVARHGATT